MECKRPKANLDPGLQYSSTTDKEQAIRETREITGYGGKPVQVGLQGVVKPTVSVVEGIPNAERNKDVPSSFLAMAGYNTPQQ